MVEEMQIDDPDGLVTAGSSDSLRNETLLSDEYFSGPDSGELEDIGVEHKQWKMTPILALLGDNICACVSRLSFFLSFSFFSFFCCL